MKIIIPGSVPETMHAIYEKNYRIITKNTPRLLLLLGDQKYNNSMNDLSHLFSIAQYGTIGAMVCPLNLIAQYGAQFPNIQYIVKLNARINPLPNHDSAHSLFNHIEQIINFKNKSRLAIRGIGIATHLESSHESQVQAAQAIYQAHQHGLTTFLLLYPRQNSINPFESTVIANAAKTASLLGADFVNIRSPKASLVLHETDALQIAVGAAGNTKVICYDNKLSHPEHLFKTIEQQLLLGNTAGTTIGKNVFEQPLEKAIAITKAVSALIYEEKAAHNALELFNSFVH